MKDIRDRVAASYKRAGTVVLIVVALLLSASLSWADTTIYVYLDNTGNLTVKTFDSYGDLTEITQTSIPRSCYTPELFWDSGAGALRMNGFDANGDPNWTGTIDVGGQFTILTGKTVNCASVTVVPSAVSAIYPDSIPCVSYSPWSACTNGFLTRTGIPSGCDGQLLSIPCSTAPACDWSYGSWTPATCSAGSIQTRTAIPSPSGCVGFPDDLTIQACPPQACTDYLYSSWGTCTNNSQSRTVTGYTPQGCSGTPSASPALTQSCTSTVACTDYTYSSWGTCTNNSQSRTVTGYTPQGCSGTPSTSSLLTQACSSGGSAITPLVFSQSGQHWPLLPGEGKVLSVTAPVCNTTAKQLRFSLGGLQSNPIAHILAKKINGDPSLIPTKADYDRLYALTGTGKGPYATTDGFFWKFNGDANGETLIVYNTYIDKYLAAPLSTRITIPGFTQAGDYYLYVINTSTTQSMEIYVGASCY